MTSITTDREGPEPSFLHSFNALSDRELQTSVCEHFCDGESSDHAHKILQVKNEDVRNVLGMLGKSLERKEGRTEAKPPKVPPLSNCLEPIRRSRGF